MAIKSNFNKLERELYLNEKIKELTTIYTIAQKKLDKMLRSIDLTAFQRYRTEQILKEVNGVVRGLNASAVKWSADAIPIGYERGFDAAGDRLKVMGITRSVNWDAQIHTSAVNILVDETTVRLLVANDSIKKGINYYIRRTQQKILEDKRISQLIAQGLIEGQPRKTVSDVILQELRGKLGEEEFITINGRNYQPKHYSKLLARTQTREATTRGTVNTSLQYGNDLVQISAHAGSCNICLPFQGRVYSISGTDPEFRPLDEDPPFHPNCAHILIPTSRKFMQRRLDEMQYKNLVDLSKTPKMPKAENKKILLKHTKKTFNAAKKKYNLVESLQEYNKVINQGVGVL